MTERFQCGTVALVGLPEVLPLESPCSWLTRAALSQGVKIKEFLRYLGLAADGDIDRAFLSAPFPPIAGLCGFRPDHFAAARRIFRSLWQVDPCGRRLLLFSSSGQPRYRVCPRCAGEQRAPFHGIHGRFSVWRYCPEHNCLLEDRCWSCKAEIVLPGNLMAGGRMKARCACLSQCFECGEFHRQAPAVEVSRCSSLLSDMDLKLLANGRATLAALYTGRVKVEDGQEGSLGQLRALARAGLLTSQSDRLSADACRERASIGSDPTPVARAACTS